MTNASLTSETVIDRIKRQTHEMRDVPLWATVPFYLKPREMLALVECAERLVHVVAEDERAVRELREAMGVKDYPSAEYSELMAANKAALDKLEAL